MFYVTMQNLFTNQLLILVRRSSEEYAYLCSIFFTSSYFTSHLILLTDFLKTCSSFSCCNRSLMLPKEGQVSISSCCNRRSLTMYLIYSEACQVSSLQFVHLLIQFLWYLHNFLCMWWRHSVVLDYCALLSLLQENEVALVVMSWNYVRCFKKSLVNKLMDQWNLLSLIG